MSKIRKQSREKYGATEIFSDEDFDAVDFADHMEERGSEQRSEARSGWRRIEELREERLLRSALREFQDWDEFDHD